MMNSLKPKLVLFFVYLCFFVSLNAEARDRRFGAGIILGEPTGFTGKYYFTENMFGDVILSWSFIDDSFVMIGDAGFDLFEIDADTSSADLPVYIGVGGKLGLDQGGANSGSTEFVVRVPVGLAAQFHKHPVEVFFEVAPGVGLAPATRFDITGGVGVRYYF